MSQLYNRGSASGSRVRELEATDDADILERPNINRLEIHPTQVSFILKEYSAWCKSHLIFIKILTLIGWFLFLWATLTAFYCSLLIVHYFQSSVTRFGLLRSPDPFTAIRHIWYQLFLIFLWLFICHTPILFSYHVVPTNGILPNMIPRWRNGFDIGWLGGTALSQVMVYFTTPFITSMAQLPYGGSLLTGTGGSGSSVANQQNTNMVNHDQWTLYETLHLLPYIVMIYTFVFQNWILLFRKDNSLRFPTIQRGRLGQIMYDFRKGLTTNVQCCLAFIYGLAVVITFCDFIGCRRLIYSQYSPPEFQFYWTEIFHFLYATFIVCGTFTHIWLMGDSMRNMMLCQRVAMRATRPTRLLRVDQTHSVAGYPSGGGPYYSSPDPHSGGPLPSSNSFGQRTTFTSRRTTLPLIAIEYRLLALMRTQGGSTALSANDTELFWYLGLYDLIQSVDSGKNERINIYVCPDRWKLICDTLLSDLSAFNQNLVGLIYHYTEGKNDTASLSTYDETRQPTISAMFQSTLLSQPSQLSPRRSPSPQRNRRQTRHRITAHLSPFEKYWNAIPTHNDIFKHYRAYILSIDILSILVARSHSEDEYGTVRTDLKRILEMLFEVMKILDTYLLSRAGQLIGIGTDSAQPTMWQIITAVFHNWIRNAPLMRQSMTSNRSTLPLPISGERVYRVEYLLMYRACEMALCRIVRRFGKQLQTIKIGEQYKSQMLQMLKDV